MAWNENDAPWYWPFPIASMIGSSAAIVFGQHVYGKNKRPVVRRLNQLFQRIRDGVWWVRHRVQVEHRYHLIDTGLKPGYHDVDERLLHGVMQLVVAYVEARFHGSIEELDEYVAALRDDENDLEAHASTEESIGKIYRWWRDERPKEHARYDELLHSIYGGTTIKWGPPDEFDCVEFLGTEKLAGAPVPLGTSEELHALQDELLAKDQEMLHLVIEVRPALWT